MKEINSFCKNCRFVQNLRCICPNSAFFSISVDEEDIDFSSCEDRYSFIDSENISKSSDEGLFDEE